MVFSLPQADRLLTANQQGLPHPKLVISAAPECVWISIHCRVVLSASKQPAEGERLWGPSGKPPASTAGAQFYTDPSSDHAGATLAAAECAFRPVKPIHGFAANTYSLDAARESRTSFAQGRAFAAEVSSDNAAQTPARALETKLASAVRVPSAEVPAAASTMPPLTALQVWCQRREA